MSDDQDWGETSYNRHPYLKTPVLDEMASSGLRLSNLIEARVGKGKLIVCSLDLKTDLDTRPEARQMRYSLIRYVKSGRFDPQQTLEPAVIQALFKECSPLGNELETMLHERRTCSSKLAERTGPDAWPPLKLTKLGDTEVICKRDVA